MAVSKKGENVTKYAIEFNRIKLFDTEIKGKILVAKE